MTVRDGLRQAPPVFPEEFPEEERWRITLPMRTPSYWLPDGSGGEIRRAATKCDPVRFALTYFGHYLRHPVTGQLSFSPMHLDLAARAGAWMVAGRSPREATIAPRRAAKSTWLFLILPLWALAHGHKRFLMAFSYTDKQAKVHLGNIVRELDGNEWLRLDYPQLVPSRGQRSSTRVVTVGGQTLSARGLGASTLGDRSGPDRPDLLLGDDMEPAENRYGPRVKDEVLTVLRQGILPMGTEHAVVQLTGTVTKVGSVAHDMANAARGRGVAPWIAEEGFDCTLWDPILDEGTPRERSLWPQWETLAALKAKQGTKSWALNYANDPELIDGIGYWTNDLIRVNPRLNVSRRIIYIDPHMGSARSQSDSTALVLLGLERFGRQAVVEVAEAGDYRGLELTERIFQLTEWDRARPGPDTLHEVWVEKNQGSERWRHDILHTMPPGVQLHLDWAEGKKAGRIEAALTHYQRGAVVHASRLPQLEQQMLGWTPTTDGHGVDDLLDALAGGLRQLFPGSKQGVA